MDENAKLAVGVCLSALILAAGAFGLRRFQRCRGGERTNEHDALSAHAASAFDETARLQRLAAAAAAPPPPSRW